MKKTAVVYSPNYLAHNTGLDCPESSLRLQAIMRGIERTALLKSRNPVLIEPRPASPDELQLVHSHEYISLVKRVSRKGGGYLDENTTVSRESYEVARLASGGAIKAVCKVMTEEFRNAFALVRPPGHHAGARHAMGFCIFNNVALAAAYLLARFGLQRVLVFDIDAHHGNGTQETFYSTDRVLYISLHEDPSLFPRTGFMNETGMGQGSGFTVNVPFPFGTGDPSYWNAVKAIAMPIAMQYKPQFILVSAGFDGYYRDDVGELSLSAYIYPRIFRAILDLAHKLSKDRVVAVLEGGYCPSFLEKIVPGIVAQMTGLEVRVRDRRPYLDLEAQKRAERVVRRVRAVQSSFWTL